MALALIVLAIGSVVAGYVGVPHALGGANRIEHFLEPSASRRTPARRVGSPQSRRSSRAAGAARRTRRRRSARATELMLMALSSGVALAGIGIAAYFFLQEPTRRRRDGAQRFRPVYTPAARTSTTSTRSTTPPIVQPIKHRLDGRAVEGRRRRADRRRRQRRRRAGRRRERGAAPRCRPDRSAPTRRRCSSGVVADPRLLPVAMSDD